jgi:AcrR family transcriptional regulator
LNKVEHKQIVTEMQPRRRYDGSRRQAQARATQREIVRAAHDLFVAQGYGTTTIAAIAAAAGVSVPTVYAGFPTKADLLRRAIETAITGDDAEIPLAERPTAQWVADTDDPAEVLRRYAVLCGEVASRVGRIYAVLVAAADAEPALAQLLDTFEAQRLVGAQHIAGAVHERGGLAAGTSPDHARDVVWMANSPELYTLAVRRNWPLDRYVALVRAMLLQVVAEPEPPVGPPAR